MSYHHLTTFERGLIQKLLTLGYSHREISKNLHRHRSCIDREVLRNETQTGYDGETAHTSYQVRRMESKPRGKRTDDLVDTITEKLLETWSPEQIANTNLFLINSRPRKCLDWQSPIQVFLHEVAHLT